MEERDKYCEVCGEKLDRAFARWDSEPTFVGYLPCKKHPKIMFDKQVEKIFQNESDKIKSNP